MAQFAVQVGAAALAVGLSLAGPQAVGLAAADTGDSPSDSSVGSESTNQSRAGKPAGTRRSAAPRSAAARNVSPNKPVTAPPEIPHVLPAPAETVAVDVPVPSASWLRVGGSDPAAAAPVPAATVAVSLPTPPVAVKAPQAAAASAGAPAGVSSALARFMSTVLPAGGIGEGALLLLRRGVGSPTIRTATVPRPAATVDANGNQIVTLNDPTQVTQGSFSIQGGSAYGPGVLDSLVDLANGGYSHDYIAVSFTAAETKTYVFGETNVPLDNAMVVYDGAFNPASPSTNAIAVNNNRTSPVPNGIDPNANGPQVSVNLTAGQTVTVMITTASASMWQAPLALPQTIYTNGAGNFFKPGSANQFVTFTSPSEVGQGVMSIRGVLFGLFGGTLNSLSDLASGAYAHNYVAVKFTASETNTYVFGQTGAPVDTVMTLYNGTFDPTHPSTNALVLNDNTIASARPVGIVMDPGGCGGSTGDCPQVSANLTAGQTVTLVISTARANATLGLPQKIYASVPGYFSSVNTPGNAPPSGNFTVGQPDANGHVTIVSNVTDPNSDPITYTVSDSEKGGTTTVNGDGTFTYTPSADARHAAAADGATGNDLADSFTITAADGRGGFASTWLVVSVTPANVAPAGNPSAAAPNQSTGVVAGSVNSTDADSDTVTYTASTPGKGTVTVAADGTFTYTPTALARHAAAADGAPASATSDSFNVTMYDGHGGTTVVPVSVVVGAANAVPTGNLSVGLPDATGRVTGNASVTDADFDPLTYTASAPGLGSVTLGPNGSFTYTPTDTARHAAAAGGATADSFTITVTDGHGGTLTIPVAVAISPTNVVPNGNVSVGAADAAGRVSGTVNANDGDADAVTYTASAPGLGSVVLGSGGSFSYTPSDAARHAAAAGGPTADAFTITVDDGHGGTITVPVSVTITSANAAPAGSVNVGSADAAGIVTGTATAIDGDSDALSYKASAPGLGSVVLGPDGSFTYTPTDAARHAAAAVGGVAADGFTITVSDGHGGTLDMPVAVAITPVNVAPAASLSLGSPSPSGMVTGAVAATDADSDPLTYTASSPANGNVTVNADGTFTYSPAAHKSASGDSFTITVSDGHGGTVDVAVTVPAPAAEATADAALGGGGGGGGAGVGVSSAGTTVAAAAVTEAAALADIATTMGTVEAAAAAAAAETAPAAAAAEAPAGAAEASPTAAAAEAAASAEGDASKDGSSGHRHGAHDAFASGHGGQQQAAMTAGRSAGKSAGTSAGKPFPSTGEEAEKAGPYSPSNPAAALGLVGMLLMAVPMAGVGASAAAAGSKVAT